MMVHLHSLGCPCVAGSAEQACETIIPRSRQRGQDDLVTYVEGEHGYATLETTFGFGGRASSVVSRMDGDAALG